MITSPRHRSITAWAPLAAATGVLVAWDVAVTAVYYARPAWFDTGDFSVALFGSAIALFVGFAVNAAYARWWEARTLWGAVVNSSRSLARQAITLIDDPRTSAEVVDAQIAYVHALRTALRRQDLPEEVADHLSPAALGDVRAATNAPTAILLAADRAITRAEGAGAVGPYARIQLEATLVALTDAQGGLERIKNTPLPVHYRVLPALFARLFCVVLPFFVAPNLGWATPIGSGLISLVFLLAIQAGRDLAEPFSDSVHDIPMTALCRTIQIDLAQMLGQPAPPKVEPVDEVLW